VHAVLGDVLWRLAMAESLIENGDVVAAYGVLRDLEDDLVVVRDGVAT
jgi:hypothetical protein